jgi:hypothetical protein
MFQLIRPLSNFSLGKSRMGPLDDLPVVGPLAPKGGFFPGPLRLSVRHHPYRRAPMIPWNTQNAPETLKP